MDFGYFILWCSQYKWYTPDLKHTEKNVNYSNLDCKY